MWAHAWVVGDFIWTALDYIGESAIGNAAYTSAADPLGACFTYDTSWSWHTVTLTLTLTLTLTPTLTLTSTLTLSCQLDSTVAVLSS